jgi:cell division GTPase FtsZ
MILRYLSWMKLRISIREEVDPDANIIVGSTIDEDPTRYNAGFCRRDWD